MYIGIYQTGASYCKGVYDVFCLCLHGPLVLRAAGGGDIIYALTFGQEERDGFLQYVLNTATALLNPGRLHDSPVISGGFVRWYNFNRYVGIDSAQLNIECYARVLNVGCLERGLDEF